MAKNYSFETILFKKTTQKIEFQLFKQKEGRGTKKITTEYTEITKEEKDLIPSL